MATSKDHDDAPCSSTDGIEDKEAPDELFPGCSNINDFSQQMLRSVLQATKASNDLPTGDDYEYYSTFDDVRNTLDMEARRLLHLLKTLMRYQNVKGTISGTDHALELDEQFDVMMDANDQILERVGTWVDEATGVRKNEQKLVVSAVNRPNPAVASWNKKRSSTGSPSAPMQLLTAKNIQRPQLSFRDKIDNSNKPFVPILRHKPHAKVSLQESLQLPADVSLEDTESPDFVYPHPYKFELDEWQPSPEQLESVTPKETKPVDDVEAEFIDTVSGLAELCDLLKKEKEFAVDLEHHSYRSFQGFVCLMQVSTRHRDFLIDTLVLRSDMYILNEVFADPNITKVFHGADSDIEWLQRDFGLYVVNMFDTGQAARVLNCARFSLAHLLQVYCQVEADKQYQLSDWRMRPLHEKMIRYAQEDTHHLLYIYDRMRNELIDRGNEQKNLLLSVYQRSKNICLRVYKKVILTPDSHLDLYMKSKKVFNSQQIQGLRDIYFWRDRVAREEDESTQYVLPNHMLLQMAEILPRERQGVLACCNPIPPLVRQCQHEIHNIIMEARETALTVAEEKKRRMEPSLAQHPQYHTTITAGPHDLSKQTNGDPMDVEVSDLGAIPWKSSSSQSTNGSAVVMKNRPVLQALASLDQNAGENAKKVLAIMGSFLDPYAKFLPVEAGTQRGSIVKPKTSAKDGMVWRLKANTKVAGHKRKSDVDLNTFAPEYVPPAKRQLTSKTVTTSPETATTTAAHTQPSSSSITPPPPPTTTALSTAGSEQTPQTEKEKKKKKKKEKEKTVEEETPLSSRQMMKKKKKEKKAKKLLTAAETPAAETAAQPASVPSTPQPTEEKKKKKKKKKGSMSVSFAAEPGVAVADDGDEEEEERKKKKKKKKKKQASAGGMGENVEESITPFDYAAADKSAVTGKVKKVHADVFNPNFKGGQKKQNKGKKKRFGAKQRKSVTFT